MILLFALSLLADLSPHISQSESIYQSVDAGPPTQVVCTTGSVIPNGQKIGVYSIILNGDDPGTSVMVVYDRNGGSEKIFRSTAGDVDSKLEVHDPINQVTGDGVKKLQVCILNDKTVESPIVGGAYEVVDL